MRILTPFCSMSSCSKWTMFNFYNIGLIKPILLLILVWCNAVAAELTVVEARSIAEVATFLDYADGKRCGRSSSSGGQLLEIAISEFPCGSDVAIQASTSASSSFSQKQEGGSIIFSGVLTASTEYLIPKEGRTATTFGKPSFQVRFGRTPGSATLVHVEETSEFSYLGDIPAPSATLENTARLAGAGLICDNGVAVNDSGGFGDCEGVRTRSVDFIIEQNDEPLVQLLSEARFFEYKSQSNVSVSTQWKIVLTELAGCDASWSNLSGGNLGDASNWTPTVAPSLCSNLSFELPGIYDVSIGFDAVNLVNVNAGEVTFNGGTLRLNSTLSVDNDAALNLKSNSNVIVPEVALGFAGGTPPAFSSLVLDGGSMTVEKLRVGGEGIGKLGVLRNDPPFESLLVAKEVIVGDGGANEPSTIALSNGALSTWESVQVARKAPGSLELRGEGTSLQLQNLTAGFVPGKLGAVIVDGRGSSLKVDGSAVFGSGGPGALTVREGASFNAKSLGIEDSTVLLSNSDETLVGTMEVAEDLALGQLAAGTHSLNLIGNVSFDCGGDMTVGGSGKTSIDVFSTAPNLVPRVTIAGALVAGGDTSITFEDGASLVCDAECRLGALPPNITRLLFSGSIDDVPSSLEIVRGDLTLGDSGPCDVVVDDGATLFTTFGNIIVGGAPNGRASLLLDSPGVGLGAPVTLATRELTVGQSGPGTTTVRNLALAEINRLVVGSSEFPARVSLEGGALVKVSKEATDTATGEVFIGGGSGSSLLEIKDSTMDVASDNGGLIFVQKNGRLRVSASSFVAAETLIVTSGTLIGDGRVFEVDPLRKQASANTGIQGNVVISPEGTLALEFIPGQDTPGLRITGDLSQSGTLEVRFLDGFEPTSGQVLTLLQVEGNISDAVTRVTFPTRSAEFQGTITPTNDGELQLTIVNPGTAVPFDPAEGEGSVEGEGGPEGNLEGQPDAEAEEEGEVEEVSGGCNGCRGDATSNLKGIGDWMAAIIGLAVLLGAHMKMHISSGRHT